MAFRRVVVQPTIRLSAPEVQEVKFATWSTGWKTAVFWANVFHNEAAASTLDIRGASTLSVNDDVSVNPGFWPSLGTFSIPATTTGAFRSSPIMHLPDYVRWTITGVTKPLAFELIAYLWDR